MKLEEAKKLLLIIRENIEFELQIIYADKTIAKLKEYIQAIDVSTSELDRLQKENEKLKGIDLTTVYIKGVYDEKDRWRNKIREKIEELKEMLKKTINGELQKYTAGEICLFLSCLEELLKEE